jgi:hypothetical protein
MLLLTVQGAELGAQFTFESRREGPAGRVLADEKLSHGEQTPDEIIDLAEDVLRRPPDGSRLDHAAQLRLSPLSLHRRLLTALDAGPHKEFVKRSQGLRKGGLPLL